MSISDKELADNLSNIANYGSYGFGTIDAKQILEAAERLLEIKPLNIKDEIQKLDGYKSPPIDVLIYWLNHFAEKSTTFLEEKAMLAEITKRLLEPKWIPIDEFMKDPVEGLCWICSCLGVFESSYSDPGLKNPLRGFYPLYSDITHVQPIHKPKAPG